MALAHQALILDAAASSVDRAMRERRARDGAVSEAPPTLVYLEADDEVTTVVRRLRAG